MSEDYGKRLQQEIDEEAKRLYRDKYGKRNPDTLSSMELDSIKIEAARKVIKRRIGK